MIVSAVTTITVDNFFFIFKKKNMQKFQVTQELQKFFFFNHKLVTFKIMKVSQQTRSIRLKLITRISQRNMGVIKKKKKEIRFNSRS